MNESDPTESKGQRVKRLREALGWSQEHLAKLSHTNQQTIQRIETGATLHSRSMSSILQALTTAASEENLHGRARENIEKQIRGEYERPRTSKHLANLMLGLDPDQYMRAFIMYEENPGISYIREVPDRLRKLGFSGEKSYSLYISNSEMSPELDPGDLAVVDPEMPFIPHSTCVLRGRLDGAEIVIVRRLLGVDNEAWHVRAWKPDAESTLERTIWSECHRVVGKLYRR